MFGTTQDLTEVGRIELRVDKEKSLISYILDFMVNKQQILEKELHVTLSRRYFDTKFGNCKYMNGNKAVTEVFRPDELLQMITQESGNNLPEVITPDDGASEDERSFVANISRSEPNILEVVIYDVKEEKEKQEKLFLNDRLASIGEMAAGIAHELNNPLTSIIMLSQSLLQENIPEELKRDLTDINNEAIRAAEVVKNLLTFARKQAPARYLTQIDKIINDVIKLREYEQTVSNIKVVMQFDPDLPEIMADPYQMQQVFLNIILNAEQAMVDSNTGNTITIKTGRTGNGIMVSINDNGPGVPAENLKKIFYPFFTTKEIGKGTGLGLSICKSIINNHGGKIYAQSEPGRGTTINIELPLGTTNHKLAVS